MFSGPPYEGHVSCHFNGKNFVNQEERGERGLKDLLKWQSHRDPGPWFPWTTDEPGPVPPQRVENGILRATFINHATVLLQMDGLNLLTDPVWSERIGPVSFAGPKRKRPPGLLFNDLPPIDAVLLTHNHYDHMDLPTLKKLNETHHPLFIVSLGNKPLLQESGIDNVIELDWWQETKISGNLQITCVPAHHFSGRGICDRDKSLWGGYVIQSLGGPVYVAGDTGWGIHFEQIYQRFGPMRLSILPIGAYKPQWFMAPMHISPAVAVLAHTTLHSNRSLAIHFGTFQLGDDGQFEPVIDLRKALKKARISRKVFITPNHGSGIFIPSL